MAVNRSNWESVRLGDLVKITHGWPFKSELFSEKRNALPIVVGIGNFKYTGGFRFESTSVKEYTGEYPKEYELAPGDILLVMTCQTSGGEILGIPGRIPNDGNVYLHNQRMGKVVVTAPDRICPDFIYHLALTSEFNRELCVSASGTKILHTAPSRIEAFTFRLPPLPEQKAIARILGTLDDKIELNRRMNATLEAMARALFQSWFVDFDPVHAKAAGRPPSGMDAPTAALFPSDFQDSPLGEVPTSWTARPLPEVIEVNPRRTLSKGSVAPYLDMKNLPTQGHSADDVVPREFGSGTKFRNGDTLLARITPCLENGKTGFVDFLQDGQVGWGSTEYIVFAPKPPLPSEFGYLLARSEKLRTHAIQNMTGTSGRQRVPAECFNSFLLAFPSPEIAQRFGELVAPIFAKIKSNSDQSRTLATLRDTLLPKLLSGELSTATAA